MPPTRKQKNTNIVRSSSSYVHPSLESRASSASAAIFAPTPTPSSVNEQIEHLRRVHTRRATPSILEALNRPSISPDLHRLRITGPPPPRSWIEGDVGGTRTFRHGSSSGTAFERRPKQIDYFPGLRAPPKLSLLHQSMFSMAMDFDWHLEYDHVYLAQIPGELKMLLLSYIACHGPETGVTVSGLRSMFLVDGDATEAFEVNANEDIDRLDLGGSLGRGLSFKDLGKFWRRKTKGPYEAQTLDSWELSPSLATNLRFPALTKLSLAYPGSSVTWTDLLAFSRNLGSLSHLSLAHWPVPRLPSSTLVSTDPASPAPSIESFDLSEAAYLLKLLSRNTPALQYLSLEGCGAWSRALGNVPSSTPRRHFGRHAGFDLGLEGLSSSDTGTTVEWTASWRNVTHLNLSQGWIPLEVDPRFLFQLRSARGRYDTSLTLPRVPVSTTPAPPSTLQQQARVFPTTRSTSTSASASHTGAPQESYTITAPSSVANSVQAASRRRRWCQQALEALLVENWVRLLRKTAGGKLCIIDHGWDASDLTEIGYAEQDLFAAGF